SSNLMNPASGALLSLAYILGLLSTAVLGLPTRSVPWGELALLAIGVGLLGAIAALIVPRFWKTGPRPRLWLISGIVAALAILHFQVRVPQPAANDISQYVRSANSTTPGQVVTVQGRVESIPRLTRSQQGQFWLRATQLNEVESSDNKGAVRRGVTGRLYVTVPLLQATGLYPSQTIAVTGVLYKPQPVKNPGAFNFGAYLAKEGAFAGFSGRQISELDDQDERPWGWWILRQRIIRSQLDWLGSPYGQLVSSMVLGGQAVDIPYDIRDYFIQAGLAHALAASGTQTSLILGLLVVLTKRFSVKTQLIVGTSALTIFVGLTGLQPSVLRAAIMGFGALVALVTQRKVKPLGSLLVAAMLLLLFNPLWIWDLGFQLSFLATLGLLVTVPPLLKGLDWLPSAIAAAIAIPLAASLWTLPLQLSIFGIVAPYSTIANIIAAPFIGVISIGAIVSALAALVSPVAGSAIAWLLYYPTQVLIGLVESFSELPGSSIAVGTISLVQLLLLYGLIGIISISKSWQRRWWLASFVALTIVVLPLWQTQAGQFQATILATAQEQVLVIQDYGRVTVINTGEEDTARFTVLPFLQKQGINQIDWAVAIAPQPNTRIGWLQMVESLPIAVFYDSAKPPSTLPSEPAKDIPEIHSTIAKAVQANRGTYQVISLGQKISVGTTFLELINAEAPVLRLQIQTQTQSQIQNQTWLMLGTISPDAQNQLVITGHLPRVQVLWWSGDTLTQEFLDAVKPKVAIASSNSVNSDTAKLLQKNKIQLYWTGRDGAIQWTPTHGFETTLETINKDAPLL
ncbi:MAG TPA: ComEC/Rec2 family competence protein, partial [Coleofasciculaceae cyanobacterium]